MSDIQLTETAVAEIKKVIESQQRGENTYLRAGIASISCSGVQYTLGFTEDTNEDDILIKQDDLQIVVNKQILEHIKGTVIDYKVTPDIKGFTFSNPTPIKSCGGGSCGSGSCGN